MGSAVSARHSSRLLRRTQQNRLTPQLLRLEDRAVPSATTSVFNRGDFYRADGQQIGLDRRTDLLTVKVDPFAGESVISELVAVGGPLQGFQVLRTLETNEYVLQSPPSAATGPNIAFSDDADPRLQLTEGTVGVIWVAPVFQNAQVNNWMAVTDEIIVALNDGSQASSIFSRDQRFSDFRPLAGTPDQFIVTLADQSGAAALSVSEELLSDSRISWTSPNFWQNYQRYYTPNDTSYSSQWHLNTANDSDVDAPEAWDIIQGGSSSVVVAIVDDGIEITHPDLAANIWTNPGEVAGDSIDNDGNGWIDDINGWDFTANDNNPGPDSGADEHGTATAGVAAAVGNNGLGVTGMAFKSKILPARIFAGASSTSDANIASAIYYSAGRTANGVSTWTAANLTSNSWGGGGSSTAMTNAFSWATSNAKAGKGVPSFIATGNDSASTVSYPANLSSANSGVIAVGSSTNGAVRPSYSNYGAQVDIVAPSNGGSLSITTTDRTGANGYSSSDYTSSFGGTSSATPLAAGIGALVLAIDPTLTASQVRGLLRNTTDYIGPVAYSTNLGFNTEYGYGRTNALTAVTGVGKAEIQVLDGISNVTDGTTTIDFGTVTVGSTALKTFRIRNQGTLPLSLSGLTVAAPFSIITNFTDTSLAAGEIATFTIRFSPSASGLQSQTLTFTNNDINEGAFDFTIRGTGTAANVSGRIYEDRNVDGSRAATEPTIPGALAFLDLNNNGWLDVVPAQNIPATIPNAGPINSTLNVAGFTGTVTDVNVTLNISHTRDQDLDIYLVGPNGTKVTLSTDNGGTNDNYTKTVFDDQAAGSVTAGTGPFTGSFRPETVLSALNGLNPNGVWTLQVSDDSTTGTAGSLLNWSITFNNGTAEPVAIPNAATGVFSFNNVAAGNYTLRRINPSGTNASGVTSHSFNLASGSSVVSDLDFGLLRQNAVYGRTFQDLSLNGLADSGDPSIAGRVVYDDFNNNGVFDSLTSTNGAVVAIPDNSATGASTTISVVGFTTVSQVRVKANISHTWVGDLALTLISPSGTSIPLATNIGAAGTGFSNTIFDDTALLSINEAQSPFTGSFRPVSALSTLIGQNANGTWTLKAVDNAVNDVGTINNWTLELFEANGTTNADGQYVVANLNPMTHRIREVLPAGWTESSPITGSHSVTVVAGQSYTGQDFGSSDSIPALNVSVNQAVGQIDPTNSDTINFTVVFSLPVTNFETGDVDIGGSAGATTAIITGSGSTYNVAVSGMTQTGDVIITVPAGVASTGSVNSNWSTSVDNSVRYDATEPTAVAGSLGDIISASSSDYQFQVTISDETAIAVSSIGTGDIHVTGPNGFDVAATLVSLDNPNDGTPRVATFAIAAPAPGWSANHNGVYSINLEGGAFTDTADNASNAANLGTFNVAIAPTVANFQINDGSNQRSLVKSFTVAFGSVVTLPGVMSDAFALTRTGPGGPSGDVVLTIDTVTLSTPTQTIAKITFSGSLTENGSLIDGRYDFRVFGNHVSTGGISLDGDNNGLAGGDYVVSQLHRLFGDSDGNASVIASDFAAFRGVFGLSGPSIFDNNDDGATNAADFAQFRGRFGITI